MVDDPQHPLNARPPETVVERRGGEHHHKRRAVYAETHHPPDVTVQRRKHHEDSQPRNAQPSADAVGHAVRDFLAGSVVGGGFFSGGWWHSVFQSDDIFVEVE